MKKLQGIIIGLLIGTIMMSGIAYAKQTRELISVAYSNIKILIDGKEYHPKDAGGNTVEPFIYNGTTYLPVRAIGNAFNKDVDWNAENSTVILGSKAFDYLNKLSYVDNNQEYCTKAEFTLKDNGIKLYQTGGGIYSPEGEYPKHYVAYKLDGNYKKFIAEIYNDESNGEGAKVHFKGNGKNILYSMPGVSYETPKTEIEIDVSGQNILYIEVENLDGYEAGIILDNARLLK